MLRTITATKASARTTPGSVQPNRLISSYERLQYRFNEYLRHRVIWRGYRKLLLAMVDIGSLPFGGGWTEAMQSDATTHLERFNLPTSSVLWHRAFHAANGLYDSRYISEPLFFSHIEPSLSQRSRIGKYFDKNFYGRLQITDEPLVLARVVGGRLAGADLKLIDVSRLCALVKPWPEVVVKPALDSGGGNGIHFIESGNIVAMLAQLKRNGVSDLVIQAPICQCTELAELNNNSVNTLRVLTLRFGKNVVNLSTVLRIGRAGARVDNLASGGLSVGVTSEGKLKAHAYDHHFVRYERHPENGTVFLNHVVPSYTEAVTRCIDAHTSIPDVDLISWDVAVNADRVPVIIELNMNLQGIGLHQLSNGPLFGKLTDGVHERFPYRPKRS
ncbi:sugar-transfer associated ATP-grasp domain-containing protein [Paraburkholderia bannensis]|uniref:sugar-transfer associated ATP-grasp domain-containing protein n=1 Tax=Paraburkholderia bannensis TaxID=765414 RepID=UPI002ABD76FD|nr:sugar-transfer associated ATP-grasp domain-containing protein [Paraburkholderia bannensis]